MSRAVLVVDDNAVTRKLVRFSLEAAGFDVREAATAEAAVASARSEPPDLVLQDLVLPDVDGFELLERLRAVVGAQVPILAFTGLLPKLAESRLGGAGFDDVISKPVEPTRLRQIVRGYFQPEGEAEARFGTDKRIVLADDDAVQRKLATFRLSRLGFEVIPAVDGEEALDLVRARRPHVVVSDVLMPRMDGFELCSRIRSDAMLAATPVVLLTNSYLEESDRELARRVGADDYVVRTPELAELSSVLRKTLGSPTRRTETPGALDPTVQHERVERAMRQLDRQVTMNATLTQRSAMLSAELTILGTLAGALAEHGDADAALDAALSSCFDAGGISWGVLLLRTEGGWSRRALGLSADSLSLAGPALEQVATEAQRGSHEPRLHMVDALSRTEAGAAEVLVAPIVHREERLGALLLGAGDGLDDHRAAFAAVVASQIALTVALGRSFRAIERANETERARVRLLQSILDAIEDPIVVANQRFEVTHWNRAADERGFARRSIDPRTWPSQMALHQPDQRTPYEWDQLPIVRSLRGERVPATELAVLRPGAPPVWLSAHAQPVLSEDGAIESAVSIIRDVTAEKRAQGHQIVADRMASIGVLAAGVAHEINNPLSAVIMELDMAIEDVAGTSVQAGLEIAKDAADRVRTIVRDLKTLSRGETDDVAVVDVSRALQACARMAGAETRARASVVLELEQVPGVLANEARLGQVFLNLVVNAAHAIPLGSASKHRITLRTRRGDTGDVIVEVSDTGVGMTPELRARLFTPFFTTKPIGVGSGLGLSICQTIVTKAGGTIEVDTAPGAGTTFRLRFPAASQRTPIHAAASLLPGTARVRVLAVDDDPLVLSMISRALRPERDVDVEASAESALARLTRGDAYQAVIYDVAMPEVPGRALLARLAASRPELVDRLVFLVGSTASSEARAFLASSGAATLPKPLDAGSVRTAIERLGSRK
jgi:PAS domain S-box-containing protein